MFPPWCSYWLDLEVERNQTEHQGLQILDQVVEDAETLGVGGLGDVDEGANFRSLGTIRSASGCWPRVDVVSYLEGDVLGAESDFELLPAVFVLLGPL